MIKQSAGVAYMQLLLICVLVVGRKSILW